MTTSRKLRACVLLLSAATLAACSTPTLPVVDTSLQSFRPIGYSSRDTCATQQQIAAHNSVYDTLKNGKAVIYQAPCEGKKAAPQEAKTS